MESQYNEIPGLHKNIRYPKTKGHGRESPDFNLKDTGFDIRVNLMAVMLAGICALFLKQEICLGILTAAGTVWLCANKQIKTAVILVCIYSIMTLLLVQPADPIFGSLLVLANIIRRMLIPAFLAAPLSKTPTGMLIAGLGKMGIPRQITIALAVLLRFMPTVGTEYRAIRIAQKFRGIGVNVLDILLHPARSYETILVPLLIRTTRIADELSASAILRGVSQNGKTTSFRDIRFTKKDWFLVLGTVVLGITLLIADKHLGGKTI
jgi:energy-coupling factor transport system permease protein